MCGPGKQALCTRNNCDVCFNKSFASSPKVQYWSDTNDITPRQIKKGSNTKIAFNCDICEHEFIIPLNAINRGSWCPYCAHASSKLCNNECDVCFNKSFASSPKAEYWSHKNSINPRDIRINSSKSFIFNCDKCSHEFDIVLGSINAGSWCPYCSITNSKVCGDYECNICLNKSFAVHPKADYWSNKNKLEPWQVCIASGKNILFNCEICYHEFSTRLESISNRNSWCPYCAKNSDKICINDDCTYCLNKSFAVHPRADNWSSKNKSNPREFAISSSVKFWFTCDEEKHEFKLSLNAISHRGQWCPDCRFTSEKKLSESLKNKNYDIETNVKFDWCINTATNYYLPFDLLIEKYKIIIELDGPQHFIQVSNWKSPDHQRKRDVYKMKLAKQNGYTVIRILQTDVRYDKNLWMSKLDAQLYLRNTPEYVFISSGNEYENFI